MSLRLCFLPVFLLIGAAGFTQVSEQADFFHSNFDAEYFFNKSKKQKKRGWILLGTGVLLNTAGISLVNALSEESKGYGAVTYTGLAAIAGSLPFFYISSENKNRGTFLGYQEQINGVESEEERNRIVKEADEYFRSKSKTNRAVGIVLCAMGGVSLIQYMHAEISQSSDRLWLNDVALISGLSVCAVSIPFYVKAANLKKLKDGVGRKQHDDKTAFKLLLDPGLQRTTVGFSLQF